MKITIKDAQSILNRIALEHGFTNIPVIYSENLGQVKGRYHGAINTIGLNLELITWEDLSMIVAHELFHANDNLRDGTNKRELRANLFHQLYK